MEEIQNILRQLTALDASLYAASFVLAILLRFGRASFVWMDDPHTMVGAILLGVVGAVLNLNFEDHALGWIVMQGLSLSVAVLIVERILRAAATKFPWLPVDNAWVKPEDKPKE